MVKKLKASDLVENEEQQYQNLVMNEQPQSDEISLKAIDELLNPKKIKVNSRIKFEQVKVISKLFLFSKMFDDTFTKQLANLILNLQVSTNGLGRRELVQLVQQRFNMEDLLQGKKRVSKDIFK